MIQEYALAFAALSVMAAGGFYCWRYMKPETELSRAAKQLAEARIAALEHRASAEHHAALADMYTVRAKRLAKVQA